MFQDVFVEKCNGYSADEVRQAMDKFDHLFAEAIAPGLLVAIKPNWIAPHHKYDPYEWGSVITHPSFVTGIINKVVQFLNGSGKIVIADAPQTDSPFEKIIEKMPVKEWHQLAKAVGIDLEILDLRDHVWVNRGGVIVSRRKLRGDPMGSVEFNLKTLSEFEGHIPSAKGYYGADVNTRETTSAHCNGNHIYRVSRTIIEADVFINLPKLKTHKKAGITCSLKNLVGINTYKNFLPHHTEGTPAMGGDQFPDSDLKSSMEVHLLGSFRRVLSKYDPYSKYIAPVKRAGIWIFGDTRGKVRNGNWYGNDTLWRTILDLNKLLLYGNTDGSMKDGNTEQQKKYLSFVDGIIAGEGNGPEAPDPVNPGLIIGGSNPVSVDCVAAKLTGFDYLKIPSLKNAFRIKSMPIADFSHDDIELRSESLPEYNVPLAELPRESCFCFKPHFGWTGHIEEV